MQKISLLIISKSPPTVQGMLKKFTKDMQSQEVEKRLKFEQRIGKATHLKGTPYFRINGEAIDLEKLSDKIKDLLND